MGVSWCRDGQQESWGGGGVRERGEVGGGGGGGGELRVAGVGTSDGCGFQPLSF